MKLILTTAIIALVAVGGGYAWWQYQALAARFEITPEKYQQLRTEVAAEREQGLYKPAPSTAPQRPPSPERNLYFGDLHVHTALSFDSYLFGNRFGLEDAYRFARGAEVHNAVGEIMQLQQPLDFVALTDHAETFGLFEGCADLGLTQTQREFCAGFDQPSLAFFSSLRASAEQRPMQRDYSSLPCRDEADCARKAGSTWQRIRAAADTYNQPGEFTAFAAYEYSPPLPETGKHHRNVIFRGSDVPEQAVSGFDARTAIDLWQMLERDCLAPCQFLTIPHNMNKSWGHAFSPATMDGDPYRERDWALRKRSEPLVEIFQVKGSSECAVGVGAVDEECSFEQFIPVCAEGETIACISSGSTAREGLKYGLELERTLGFNPLQVGFIASTDTHNGNPGDAEEWDYRGASAVFSATAKNRITPFQSDIWRSGLGRSPGGLAAVWAEQNTREALFDAMRRRETYATSGTRIRLRFFAVHQLEPGALQNPDLLRHAYDNGVPMGGTLTAMPNRAPSLLVWARRDPAGAPLDRVQIIKGWTAADGKRHERVLDIACGDGSEPVAGRCAAVQARVNPNTCAPDNRVGSSELKTLWIDPDYNPGVSAFYYARVLQVPTCRWSTYDALRSGSSPPKGVNPLVRERAWSSPIWLTPDI